MATPTKVRLPKLNQNGVVKIRALGQERVLYADFYHNVIRGSWWAFFGAVAAAFLVLNSLFAVAYLVAPGSISNVRPWSFGDAFFFSVQTMATIGYGGMSPITLYGHIIVTLEAIVGILVVALITGLTFAKFARPASRVLFSDFAVINQRDGVPHLTFRMANARHNQIVEARLRVVLLVSETTKEGETMRRQIDVSLVRERTALFLLTWTAMHVIDEKSPFYGPNAIESLRERKGEMFLSLTGLDETIGQTIHARHYYPLENIIANARFADVITVFPDGTRQIDYRNFHEVVPLETT